MGDADGMAEDRGLRVPVVIDINTTDKLDQLARLEQAPSIVPSIDEMAFPRSRQPSAPVTRSADPARPATNRRSVSAGS